MPSDAFQDHNADDQPSPETQHREQEFYVLYLYIAGKNIRSRTAIQKLRDICTEYLPNRHEIRVIDIYEQPELAESDRVVVTPTLVKKLPPPLRKFIGDLSDRESILFGLDIW